MDKLISGVCIASLLLITACEKRDRQAPSIDRAELNGETVEFHHVLAGTELNVALWLSDNRELRQVKISSDVASAHAGHEGVNEPFVYPALGDWSFEAVGDLNGTSDRFAESFIIPWNVGGSYEIHLAVSDMEGNISEQYILMNVINDSLPVINAFPVGHVVDDQQVIQVDAGTPLMLDGYVLDSDGLARVDMEWTSDDGVASWNYQSVIPGDHVFHLHTFSFPVLSHPGLYDVLIRALDVHGMVNWKSARLKVV